MASSKNSKLKRLKEIALNNYFAKVLSLLAAIIIVVFYNSSLSSTRYISIPLICENNGDFVPARIIPRMIRISIRGESSKIASVREDDIIGYLDVNSFSKEGEYRVPVQFKLKGTALNIEPLEINADPSELKVKLERSFAKNIDIKLAIKGSPAENYEIYETSVEPTNINVRGPYSLVEKIEDLITESIQVYNRKKDLTGVVSVINTNSLISVIGSGKIQYTVRIREILNTKEYSNIDLYIEDIDSDFEIVSVLPSGTLSVRGPKSVVEAWKPPQKVLKINCKNIKSAGKYTIPVQAVVPGRMELVNAEPKNVQIEVKRKRN